MFNLKEFQNDSVLEPIVDKLNKFLSKNKTQKVIKVIEELETLLDQPENVVSATYILSMIVEHDSELITEGIIQKIEVLLNSDDPKLRVNSILIIGFKLLENQDLVRNYFKILAEYLIDKSVDVRDNVHFFLLELLKVKPILVEDIKNILIRSLSIEQNKENLLLVYLFQIAGLLMARLGLRTSAEMAIVDYNSLVAGNFNTGAVILTFVLYGYMAFLVVQTIFYLRETVEGVKV